MFLEIENQIGSHVTLIQQSIDKHVAVHNN
jgi:hypothetical protein